MTDSEKEIRERLEAYTDIKLTMLEDVITQLDRLGLFDKLSDSYLTEDEAEKKAETAYEDGYEEGLYDGKAEAINKAIRTLEELKL